MITVEHTCPNCGLADTIEVTLPRGCNPENAGSINDSEEMWNRRAYPAPADGEAIETSVQTAFRSWNATHRGDLAQFLPTSWVGKRVRVTQID